MTLVILKPSFSIRLNRRHPPYCFRPACAPEGEKADVTEHLEMFRHVGLLFNEPPGRAGLSFI